VGVSRRRWYGSGLPGRYRRHTWRRLTSQRTYVLLSNLRMRGPGCDNPGDSSVGIRAIPNSAPRGHLVLPLLQHPAEYVAAAQLSTKPLLTGRILRCGGTFGDHHPRLPSIRPRVRQSSSQPLAASDVANRASQAPGRPGGATRSLRFGAMISFRLGRVPRQNHRSRDW
jgi:hypothetical protein